MTPQEFQSMLQPTKMTEYDFLQVCSSALRRYIILDSNGMPKHGQDKLLEAYEIAVANMSKLRQKVGV